MRLSSFLTRFGLVASSLLFLGSLDVLPIVAHHDTHTALHGADFAAGPVMGDLLVEESNETRESEVHVHASLRQSLRMPAQPAVLYSYSLIVTDNAPVVLITGHSGSRAPPTA